MAHELIKLGVTMGILVLAGALLAPPLIDATETDSSETVQLSVNESEELTDVLEVKAINVSHANQNATLNVTNLRNYSHNQTTLNVSNTTTTDLSGDTLTITLKSVDDQNRAAVKIDYPAYLGWNQQARVFMENIPIVIAMLAFVMVVVPVKLALEGT